MRYTILNPNGSTLSNPLSCGSGNLSTGNLTLPGTGTYSVWLDPGNGVGGVTATLTQEINQTLQFNTPLSVSSTLAGQIFDLTFSGTASQVIDLAFTNGSYNTCVRYTILNPDGSTLSNPLSCGSGNLSTGNLTLPSTGTYSVLIDPGNGVGGATAMLTQRSNQTLQLNTPVSVNSTLAGQIFNLTFSGTASQVIDLAFTNGTYNTCVRYTILNPDGSTLSNPLSCGSGNLSTGNLTLPSTGTYSVLLDPGNGVGGVTATLTQRINQALQYNTPLTVSSTLAGQIFDLTFSGTASQVIDLAFTSGSYNTCVRYTILNPDGSTLSNPLSCGAGNLDTGNMTLPSTGTYSVLIDPGNGVGGVTATYH
ncbi:MAG: hypothetical protein JSS95_15585 [Acidobacteria bacterium]|nr:hypothetical protein [Acidobacteriota bacterium]